MARSITSSATRGAITLIAATSRRTSRDPVPCRSISHAARRMYSRAWSMAMRDSAIHCWTTPCRNNSFPKATRYAAREHNSSRARSAMPMARMQ